MIEGLCSSNPRRGLVRNAMLQTMAAETRHVLERVYKLRGGVQNERCCLDRYTEVVCWTTKRAGCCTKSTRTRW